MERMYTLPALKYGYGDLSPVLSEEQLSLHHQKHHQAYVTGANAIFEKLDNARRDGSDLDQKATLKELSFHVGGHVLHSLFWENLCPQKNAKPPAGRIRDLIHADFGSLERFIVEFSVAATSVEGSGWAALSLCKKTGRLLIMQIEKHNTNVYPGFSILLVLDLWEHAYYLDYKNDRAAFVKQFFSIIDWDVVASRL
ncbi:MAG: superoxide dismutase [Methanospirillaceae archaeon]|nr:superoxide dismutase [Methanospirillaceae archaeon]